jgi:archaellum component FlaC
LNDSDDEIRSTIDGKRMFESFSLPGFSKKQKEDMDKVSELEATVQKLEQEVERLTREVRLAKSSEASDEVVERLKKEKDELRKIAAAMETRYKELLLLETERSEKRRRKLLKYYNLYLEQKVRKIFI